MRIFKVSVFKSAQFINKGDCKIPSNSEHDLNYIKRFILNKATRIMLLIAGNV